MYSEFDNIPDPLSFCLDIILKEAVVGRQINQTDSVSIPELFFAIFHLGKEGF